MISFPRLESWNAMTKMATIAAKVDNSRVLCRISLATLRDKFGASDEEPMKSIDQHRTTLCEVAKILIENEAYEKDGSILIRGRDI